MGWKSVTYLASKASSLTVVTQGTNQKAISEFFPSLNIPNTQFHYYDLPKWCNSLRGKHFGMQIHAYLWELGVFFFLLKQHKKKEFAWAYKTTIGSYRFPSFIWYFAKHFTWGPLCSGERFPYQFLNIYSWKGKLHEFLRLAFRRLALIDPLVLLTLYKADKIITITNDTKEKLPAFARKKAIVETKQHITVDVSAFAPVKEGALKRNSNLRLLYIGRLLEWKGIMLVLRALVQLDGKLNYELNIMGEGPAKKFYQQYVQKHGLNVNFISPHGISRKDLSAYYLTHDLFIFPGLHGTGSTVMVEAKLHKLPVLLLDITAPDAYEPKDFGIEIPTKNKTVSQVITQIAQELLALQQGKQLAFNPLITSLL